MLKKHFDVKVVDFILIKKDESGFVPYMAQAFQIGFIGLLMGNMFLTAHYDKDLWLIVGLAVAMKRLTLNHRDSISPGESWRKSSSKKFKEKYKKNEK